MQPARRIIAVLMAALVAVPISIAAAEAASDNSVRATYLSKFSSFVEWPEPAFKASAINLCVVGDDPFGALIDDAVKAHPIVDGKTLVVTRLPMASRDSDCHVMYLGGSSAQSISSGLDVMRGLPVLTVTNIASATGAKGMINFVTRRNRVRFDVDNVSATQSGLSVSSKLLNVAFRVRAKA